MKINFIDVGVIMSVVVALIILAVGVFAFFVTIQNIPIIDTETKETAQEITGDSVFNVIGVVLVVGVMMSIVGLIYNFVGRDDKPTHLKTHQKELTKPAKIKSKSKTKKKNFEWGV